MEEEFKFAVTIKKKSYFNNINEIDQTIALTFQCHYKDPVENFNFLDESRIFLTLTAIQETNFTGIVQGANFVETVTTAKFLETLVCYLFTVCTYLEKKTIFEKLDNLHFISVKTYKTNF